MGRPTDFTEEIAQEIVGRLSKGEPLASICRDDGMPAVRTVSDWKKAHAAFSADFASAREEGFDIIAMRARRTLRGLTEPDDPVGGESTGDVQRDKAIADYDLKLLAKWSKRYSDKVALVGGGEDDAPIQTSNEITVRFVRPGDVPTEA